MQRWIVVGVIVAALAVLGGGYGAWRYRQNKPDKMWVPLPINASLSEEQKVVEAAKLKEELKSSGSLLRVSKDLALAEKWKMGTDEAATAELERRLFIEPGEAQTAMGKAPSLNIGVSGTRKERNLLGDISLHLIKEVWKILGIKPPAGQTI